MLYGPNFTQTMPLESYELFGDWARYFGEEPSLQHLKNVLIPTRQVERLIPVGERECVEVEHLETGDLCAPWRGVYIIEHDEHGNPRLPEPSGERVREITDYSKHMTRALLAEKGYTDAELEALGRELLGEEYGEGNPGTARRREFYDRVTGALAAMIAEG